MELTKDERLALLEATSKRIKPLLEDAKGDARHEMLAMEGETGADRRAIKVCGVKVGEIGCSYEKPHPAIKPGREREALEYLRAKGLTEEKPARGWESRFGQAGDVVIDSETGEVVDWAEWSPKRVKGASVRGCEPQEVLDAIAPKLNGASPFALLEGIE